MIKIYANNQSLIDGIKSTFLSADVAAAASTLSVDSILGFAIDKILLIGGFGNEGYEIIKTHSSTTPTGSTITLTSGLSFDHIQGTEVYIISYDQVEFSWSETLTGVKEVLDTVNIQVDQIETQYEDSTKTSGYYFFRFKETIGNTFSEYSDPIPYGGYESNTVGAAISFALKRNHLKGYTEFIDHDFMIEEINMCLTYIHGELKRWHNLQNFDYVLGQTSRGENKFSLPSDVWQYSSVSILGFRIGDDINLTHKDKREWEEELNGVNWSTLGSAASVGATQITLNNSNDFPSNGSVMIRGVAIDYTANDYDTGILSGIPASGEGSITAELSISDSVWNGSYEEGGPSIFTIIDGYIYFWPIISATYDNKNAFLDYWKDIPVVNSDNDTLNFNRFDMIKYWLTASVRSMMKSDGIRNIEDTDFKLFLQILYKAVSLELKSHGQKFKSKPQLNKIQH